MRTCLLAIGLLVVLRSPTPEQEAILKAEAALKEILKLTNEMTEILKPINDKASAEAALPKLKAFDERFMALQNKSAEIGKLSAPSADEQKQLRSKYNKAIEKAANGMRNELERMETFPEVTAMLKKESVWLKQAYEEMALLQELKVDTAKIQIETIDTALSARKIKTGEFPENLKALTEGERPILKAESLTDPWKKPYQYDPAGPKNKGKKPDVWTITPDNKLIGNWPVEKK